MIVKENILERTINTKGRKKILPFYFLFFFIGTSIGRAKYIYYYIDSRLRKNTSVCDN